MKIKQITLLSKTEYERYERYIPEECSDLWLRPDDETKGVQCVAHQQNKAKYTITDSVEAEYKRNGIRPAIRIHGNATYQPGDEYELFGMKWTVLATSGQEIYILCNKIIATHEYDDSYTSWTTSSLKLWLDKWFKKMLLEENKREDIIISKQAPQNKTLQEKKYIITIFSLECLRQSVQDSMVQYVVFMIFLLITLITKSNINLYLLLYFTLSVMVQFVNLICTYSKTHKKIKILQAANIAISCVLFLGFEFVTSDMFLYATRITIIFINNVIEQYFKKIKYLNKEN